MMKKVLCAILCMAVLLTGLMPMTVASAEKLTDGLSPTEALALAVTCAVVDGYEMDEGSVKADGTKVTATAGIFTFTVDSQNGMATGVTVAAGYLDSEYATAMGRIFGRMLNNLGGLTDASDIIESIDFNAFNTLDASTQTLISGDYKIIVKVDPNVQNCYQFSMQLRNVETAPATAPAELSAGVILEDMAPQLSARVVYTESTDPNKKMGTAGSYTSKANFALESLSPNHDVSKGVEVEDGGSIEVFASEKEAVDRAQYIVNTKISYLNTTEYTFVCGKALLRLAPTISAEEAGQLVTSFMNAVNGTGAPAEPETPTEPEAPAEPEDPAEEPAAESTEQLFVLPESELKEGDTIMFGSYEQDNNTANGKEPIEWRVLVVGEGEALLLSTYALDVYNTYWGSTTWDNSTLRTWLNADFLNAAFSAEEQSVIIEHIVPADPNPNYSTDPGQDTEDKVFCLSYVEASNLLTAAERKTVATQYAKSARNVYTESGYCYWWLRSPGREGCGAAIACTDGSFDYDYSYDGFCYGVRPAIWVSTAGIAQ